jgi:hypothetical protein
MSKNGLSVHIFPMPNLEDRYLSMLVIDKIDNAMTVLSYAIAIDVPREFFRILRS